MAMKKIRFIFKIMLLTVLMATAKSLYAIDANVKSELLARYPSMSSLSDTQLDKVVNLLRRFPGLKNLNQQDIDSIKERIEDRRASGNRVLGSGRVIKKLIEVNPDLLANIDPGRFRMRLSQNARGAPIILDDVAAEFEGLSRNEKRDLWLSKNPMERIEILRAIKAKAETLEGWEEGKWENNRELLVNYVYEEKLTETEQERYDKFYANCTPEKCDKAGDILKDLTGNDWDPNCNNGAGCHKDGNEQNWKMFWMMPPESRRAFYHKINGGKPHFDNIASPDQHSDDQSINPDDKNYVGIDDVKFPELWVEGVQGTHMKCDHDANKFWRAFSEQYPRAWEGWFKENIWNQDYAEIEIPTWDPSNFPSDKLKDRLKDLIGRWPPLPPDLELPSKEEIKEIIQKAYCTNNPGSRACQVDRPESILSQLQGKINAFCVNNPSAKACQEVGFDPTDRDKLENLIGFLQGQEKPGWDPLPPVIEPEMEDIIAILQNYQRVETPNAEELLRRSKKTSGGS